jgi:RNA polymerase I specific transcription initiation factor
MIKGWENTVIFTWCELWSILPNDFLKRLSDPRRSSAINKTACGPGLQLVINSVLYSTSIMDNDEYEHRRRKRRRTEELCEAQKLLQTLDYQDHRDLASHLLIAAQHQKRQPKPPKSNKRGRPPRLQSHGLVLENNWTAWPLPSRRLSRPEPIPSSSLSEQHDSAPNPLHAEIEAALLRLARTQIQKDGNPSSVSANEHPPYHLTREVTDSVISKVDHLLHALGRVKFGQITSERARVRAPKTTWEEIIGIAGLPGCVESRDTMERISERCKKLFEEDTQ